MSTYTTGRKFHLEMHYTITQLWCRLNSQAAIKSRTQANYVAHHTQTAVTSYSKQVRNSNKQIFDTRSTKRKQNQLYKFLWEKEDINTFLPQQTNLEKFTLSSTSWHWHTIKFYQRRHISHDSCKLLWTTHITSSTTWYANCCHLTSA